MPRLILASASPRRLDILRSLGIEPEVRPAELEETPLPGEPPEETALRLALAKSLAASGAALPGPGGETVLVLGADTVVVVDGAALGKPASPDDACRMLALLSGREHEVLTALAIHAPPAGRSERGVSRTRVRFRPLSGGEIAAYVATGEPMDKAGAYGIQGAGGRLVEEYRGSLTNVVGLPIELLEELLGRFGLGIGDLSGRAA